MQKPAHYEELPIWDGQIPMTLPEDSGKVETRPENGGIIRIHDVTVPTVKYYPATGEGPHPALLVCPGGSYKYQAVNLEGYDIAAWLNTIGFSAFVLKYRCPQRRDAAHADAARAMRYLRANAEALQIDPERLGCIGFSAGAHLCASISAPADPIPYEPLDDLDQIPYRPDFSMLIYPAYLADAETLRLNPEFSIGNDTPSMFIVQTQDDGIKVENAFAWYLAMHRAGRPCEMHLYAEGHHGYGILKLGYPVNEWNKIAEKWLYREGKIRVS